MNTGDWFDPTPRLSGTPSVANAGSSEYQQIEDVIDTLTAVGRLDALTARLRQLETKKAGIVAQLDYGAEPPQIFLDVEKRVRQLIQSLERLPQNSHRDAALMDKTRAALRPFSLNYSSLEKKRRSSMW